MKSLCAERSASVRYRTQARICGASARSWLQSTIDRALFPRRVAAAQLAQFTSATYATAPSSRTDDVTLALWTQNASLEFSREPIMKQYSPATTSRATRFTGFPRLRTTKLAALGLSALAIGACSSVPQVTEERVATSQTAVQQAQQTIGTSESGAIELQRAKDKLALAQAAVKADRPQEAERAALQARLNAELAIAKSQSAAARKSAAEMLSSLETLRAEAERNSPTVR
jgi:hypothetical protein